MKNIGSVIIELCPLLNTQETSAPLLLYND